MRRTSYRTIDGLTQLLFEVPQLAAGDTATCFITFEVTKRQLTVDLLDANDQPVVDTGNHATAPPTTPTCGQIVIPKQ